MVVCIEQFPRWSRATENRVAASGLKLVEFEPDQDPDDDPPAAALPIAA